MRDHSNAEEAESKNQMKPLAGHKREGVALPSLYAWERLSRPGLFVALAVLAGATLIPLARTPWWPQNHEGDSFMIRTLIYASHMSQGDYLPLWSSADNGGFGSPQPALYHKLFYLVSGGLYASTGNMKTSLLLSLWIWLVIGAVGAYRLCREAGCGAKLAACGGAMLIVANYTVTNWLVRGAMAEFSASMLAPWVLAGFLRSLRLHRITLGFAAGLALIFLAHSVLAYYLVLLSAATGLFLLVTGRLSPHILSPASFGSAVAFFFLLIGPFLIAMIMFGKYYDMTRILAVDRPENQFRPLIRYFWDTQWRWGHTWENLTVQLDSAIIALLLGSCAILVWLRIRPNSALTGAEENPAVLPLVLMGVMALFLQTHWAFFFYRHMPGAAFLQFPWRLLAFLTPLSITLSLLALWHVAPPPTAFRVGLGTMLAMCITCGAFSPIRYGPVSAPPPTRNNVTFSFFGEYVPLRSGVTPPPVGELYRRMIEDGCSYTEAASPPETLRRRFSVTCKREQTVVLPLFASPFHALFPSGSHARKESCVDRPDFPGLCAIFLPQGKSEVEVRFPTFSSLFGTLW